MGPPCCCWGGEAVRSVHGVHRWRFVACGAPQRRVAELLALPEPRTARLRVARLGVPLTDAWEHGVDQLSAKGVARQHWCGAEAVPWLLKQCVSAAACLRTCGPALMLPAQSATSLGLSHAAEAAGATVPTGRAMWRCCARRGALVGTGAAAAASDSEAQRSTSRRSALRLLVVCMGGCLLAAVAVHGALLMRPPVHGSSCHCSRIA